MIRQSQQQLKICNSKKSNLITSMLTTMT